MIDVQKRASAGLAALASQFAEQEEIVCVAHGEVILLTVADFIGLPLDEMHHLTIDTACVTRLEWFNDRKRLRFHNYRPY